MIRITDMNMILINWKYITWIVILTSLLVWAKETSQVKRTWEDYKIISDHNIFVRYWSVKSAGNETAEAQIKEMSETPVLTGIARRGQETIAFFENPQTQATTLIRVGQEFENGKIVAIRSNEVVYEQGGQQRVIAIGNNLLGITTALDSVGKPEATTQEKPAAAQKTVTTKALINDSNTTESKDINAIERMMREQRLRETGE
jgi:hypothetical protein